MHIATSKPTILRTATKKLKAELDEKKSKACKN
jgi:hypothetical protein